MKPTFDARHFASAPPPSWSMRWPPTVMLPAVGVRDPDYFPLRLLAEILGGGMASRLFQEAREKRGLAYAIDAYSETYADVGVLGVFAGCAAADADYVMMVKPQFEVGKDRVGAGRVAYDVARHPDA